MSKDGIQAFADEVTLIRHEIDKLQRTSLNKDEAKALHKIVANGVKQMNESGANVQDAIDRRLLAVAAVVRDSASEAAEIAVRDLLDKNHAERPSRQPRASQWPQERPAERPGGTSAVLGLDRRHARHRDHSGAAAGLWHRDRQIVLLRRTDHPLQLRQIMGVRASDQSG